MRRARYRAALHEEILTTSLCTHGCRDRGTIEFEILPGTVRLTRDSRAHLASIHLIETRFSPPTSIGFFNVSNTYFPFHRQSDRPDYSCCHNISDLCRRTMECLPQFLHRIRATRLADRQFWPERRRNSCVCSAAQGHSRHRQEIHPASLRPHYARSPADRH